MDFSPLEVRTHIISQHNAFKFNHYTCNFGNSFSVNCNIIYKVNIYKKRRFENSEQTVARQVLLKKRNSMESIMQCVQVHRCYMYQYTAVQLYKCKEIRHLSSKFPHFTGLTPKTISLFSSSIDQSITTQKSPNPNQFGLKLSEDTLRLEIPVLPKDIHTFSPALCDCHSSRKESFTFCCPCGPQYCSQPPPSHTSFRPHGKGSQEVEQLPGLVDREIFNKQSMYSTNRLHYFSLVDPKYISVITSN